jgi:hypothetical protein
MGGDNRDPGRAPRLNSHALNVAMTTRNIAIAAAA